MPAGRHHLRDLNGTGKCKHCNEQKPEAAGIAQTKRHTRRQKNRKMLKILSGASDWPGRCRSDR